jgi:hypothetical protein
MAGARGSKAGANPLDSLCSQPHGRIILLPNIKASCESGFAGTLPLTVFKGGAFDFSRLYFFHPVATAAIAPASSGSSLPRQTTCKSGLTSNKSTP